MDAGFLGDEGVYRAEGTVDSIELPIFHDVKEFRTPKSEWPNIQYQEGAMTPPRFRTRVASQFLSHENLAYLRGLFMKQVPAGPLRDYAISTLRDAAQEFAGGSAAGDSRILDEVMSDPIAQRGERQRALDLWGEIRRLNRIFFDDRMAFLVEQSALISQREMSRLTHANERIAANLSTNLPAQSLDSPANRRTSFTNDRMNAIRAAATTRLKESPNMPALRDGIADDDESYAMRMFISDSLRPPGLEHLNGPGPNWAILEDQSSWLPQDKTTLKGELPKALQKQAKDCDSAAGIPPRTMLTPSGARIPTPRYAPRNPNSFMPPQGLAAAAQLVAPADLRLAQARGGTHSRSQVRAEVPGMKNSPTYPSYSPDVMPNPPLKQYDPYFQKQFLNQDRRTVKFADETRERFAVGPARQSGSGQGARQSGQGARQSGQGARQSGQGAPIGMNVPSSLSASGTRYTDAQASYGGVDALDAPWSEGRANRTPEAAIAEYWGDDWASSDTMIGSTEQAGVAYGSIDSWGNHWKENGGTRFMRYESIPFWQKGGREGYDYDIEETLGTAGRELDNDVRRWDMERVRVDVDARAAAYMAGPPPRIAVAAPTLPKPVQWGRYYGVRSSGNV